MTIKSIIFRLLFPELSEAILGLSETQSTTKPMNVDQAIAVITKAKETIVSIQDALRKAQNDLAELPVENETLRGIIARLNEEDARTDAALSELAESMATKTEPDPNIEGPVPYPPQGGDPIPAPPEQAETVQ